MNPFSGWPRSARVAILLFIIIAAGFILKTAQAILVPLALAILFAFLLHPLAKRLQRLGVNRTLAVVMVVGTATLLIGSIGVVVSRQVKTLADDLPNHGKNIEQRVLVLKRIFRGGTIDKLQEMIEGINRRTERKVEEEAKSEALENEPDDRSPVTGELGSDVAVRLPSGSRVTVEDDESAAAKGSTTVAVRPIERSSNPLFATPLLGSAMDVLAAAGIVILLVIFFLIQQADIRDRLVAVTGRGGLATTTKALEDAGARISRYLLMLFVVNASFGLAVGLGLALMGIEYAVMWGLCAALFRYVPYVGPWVAAILPISSSLITSEGWTQPFMVVGLFVVLELLSNNVMEPILYGHSVGLSSVGVILSAIAWGWIWGPIGLVLATPMTVCLVVLGKYVPGLRVFDMLLGERPPVGEPVRLYQRLLAKDEEEAEDLVQAYLKTHSIIETCDGLLLPTLELTHQDLSSGQIGDEDAEWMLTALTTHAQELRAWTPSQEEREPAALTSDERASWPMVVGLPAHSPAEEVALRIVQQAVVDLPCRFETLPADLLVSERLAELVEREAVAVCVSALPPGDLAHSRQICKRIRQQNPETRLFVGRWADEKHRARNEQLKNSGADDVVSTIADMHRLVSSVAQLHRASRPVVTAARAG
jgi:predicted PurR-regulated permease PerM